MYHPVDVHVGKRLQQRRALLGMSQTALGKGLGITFQQVQKYERGANRLGASKLYEAARVLGVPVSYFFDELSPTDARTPTRNRGRTLRHETPIRENDPWTKRETLELVRGYFKIRNEAVRRQIALVIKSAS